jgi:hypothetical protein
MACITVQTLAAKASSAGKSSKRAFLAVDISKYTDSNEDLPDERVFQECKRLGVGYVTDPADYNTFDIAIDTQMRNPDPDDQTYSSGLKSAPRARRTSSIG